MPTPHPIRAGEAGFTLIELLIAITVLAVGILSMLMAFDVSRKLSLVSERSAAMAHVAQKEIERIEGIPYGQIGLVSTPGTSTDPTNPTYYVAAGPPATFAWDRTSLARESLDVDATGGTIVPVQNWTEGQLSGQIYDFVTWTSDPKCAPGCPVTQDYKRVTVAVTMPGGLHPTPVFVSSVVADPQAIPTGGISNGNSGNPLSDPSTTCQNGVGLRVSCTSPIDSGNPNTFYLHDWPATSSGSPQLPSASHATHPTVGVSGGLLCTTLPALAQILSNVTGCPVPDLMDANPPAAPVGTPATLYQYSTDQATTGYPGGRLLQPTCAGGTGCGTKSTSDCNGGGWSSNLLSVQSQLWVSSPVTATTTLTGDGGISMFTQTANSAQAAVSFCVEIYDIPPSGAAGSLADLLAWPPVDLGGAGYVAATDPQTGGNWPTSPSQVSFIFNFRGSSGTVSIAPGHRLGVRLWMKANLNLAIALLYDHPQYPSEIQLNTQ
jgi:prepilin-type N-terminal cleavage/methylation domain-containing protein